MNNETKVKKGILYWLVFLGYVVTIPLLPISVMLFIGSFLAFRVEFSIQNETDSPISVTPIGTVGRSGARCLLPVISGKYIPTLSSQWGAYQLAPSESITIAYDIDDTTFSEIVVEYDSGKRGLLIPYRQFEKSINHESQQNIVSINDLTSFEEVPENIRELSLAAHHPIHLQKFLYLIILFPWIIFFVLHGINRKYTHIALIKKEAQKKTVS